MEKIKVLSLFSGIGAFEKALTNLKLEFELVGFSEIDKYAIESYAAIHNVDKSLNLGDVSKIETESIPDFDLMTYGFPCQDISVAGRQKGFSENSETRSSLLWEAMKIAKVKQPKYMIAENVKNLIGKKFKDDFDKWLNDLDDLGYNTYYEVLNSKDFGVPQNRERVFVVSIRKDIDNKEFKFPKGETTGVKLKDVLEDTINEKYYLSEQVQKRFKFNEKYHHSLIGTTAPEFRTIGQRDLVYKEEGVMGALVATDYKQPKQILEVVGNLDINGMDCIKRVYSTNGLSPTLTTMEGGNRQPKVYEGEYKIRKLTPLECWRLMSFSDEDFNIAKETLNNTYHKGKDRSDSQLYKQSGNSIVVKVAEELLRKLFN
ncbi:DNA cytosine methyltransferase [Cytobacillus gottheilii]|uniref:DNA cytosine methyltransferase n=1 Tax=Cytobacillus gottheilii TaxID=859144 RepID=UPI0009B947C9|nr:DNA cytosine methyltransferase [Cytobacillus gottheilii]